MQKINWVPAGILTAALLLGGGMFAVQAKQNKEPAVGLDAVACVDIEKVFAASDAPNVLSAASLAFERKAIEQIRAISSVPYLDVAELTEFVENISKSMPTEAQKARAKELHDLSDTRRKQVQDLSAQKNLMPDEQKFLNEMAERARNLQQAMPRIQTDLQGNEARILEGVRREQMSKLREIVGKTAKEKGFTHVYDTSSLVYATTDLTAAVLQKLPKAGKN